MSVTVYLWIAGQSIGISAALAAMIGLSILLCTGVVDWNDVLEEKHAWDILVWFSVLIGMSFQLKSMGVTAWVASNVNAGLSSMNMSWPGAFLLLHAVYFFVHYMIASQTAQIGALFSAFLAMMIG